MKTIILSIPPRKKQKVAANAIKISSLVLFNWFSDNFMKANSGQSHLLMRCIETHANIDDFMTKST